MNEVTILNIILIINAFVMGALSVYGFKHLVAHFKSDKDKPIQTHVAVEKTKIPHELKEEMLAKAEHNFEKMIDHSITELQSDLEKTTSEVSQHFSRISSNIINNETDQYRQLVEDLRKKTSEIIDISRKEIVDHQTNLKSSLSENVEAEKQLLVKQIDTKLADSVTSFLIEALQHNVDLGAQTKYIIETLETHKEDLKKEIS